MKPSHVVNYVEPFFGSGAMLLGCPAWGPQMTAPFPWFGGKSRCTDLVWERLGYSKLPVVWTVNDINGFVANFWRAVKSCPDEVASIADYPVIETDLHARHRWLVAQASDLRAQLDTDPDFCDAKIAAWWVWGLSAWIGSGWCDGNGDSAKIPRDLAKSAGGVHAARFRGERLPDLSGGAAWETGEPHPRAGRGVHSGTMRRQLPHLGGGDGSGAARTGTGIHGVNMRTALHETMRLLSERLRYVRVTCGDWARICTPAVTYRHGLTAVFLDPPYDGFEHLYRKGKANDAEPLFARVRAWALEAGKRDDMRIALCGYEGEHNELEAHGWEKVEWKAKGGYSNTGEGENVNAARERIWSSPACLKPGRDVGNLSLF